MNHLLFLNVGGSELIIIALFVLMFFGSKSIPEFMRGLGKMTREFKDAMNGLEREVRTSVNFDEAANLPEPPRQLEEKPKQSEEKQTAAMDSSPGVDEQKPDQTNSQPLN